MAVIERFFEKGKLVTRHSVDPVSCFVMGVDLGQSNDPTAIAVIHHRREVRDGWTTVMYPGGGGRVTQNYEERFEVRFLQRLPLLTPYPEQVSHVAGLMARPPLVGSELAIDDTGVGRAVGDMFDAAGLKPIRITQTAGLTEDHVDERRWHVPKGVLFSVLDARLHRGELRFAPKLTEAEATKEEFMDYQRRISAAGRASYEARQGKHDDIVSAVQIALWTALRPRSTSSWFPHPPAYDPVSFSKFRG